jgi:hypothetical protein
MAHHTQPKKKKKLPQYCPPIMSADDVPLLFLSNVEGRETEKKRNI